MKQLKSQQADSVFFAVDLGATSGRTIIGTISGKGADGCAADKPTITWEELTRFDNALIQIRGHVCWDLAALYNKIIVGLRLAAQRNYPIESIGIDTWGCDFVCIGADGLPLGNPFAYRDPHTVGKMDEYFAEAMPKAQVYEKTGIQLMNFNSLFQLYAMRKAGSPALQNADRILFMPDALSYLLTGEMVCEYTISSTSQMLNVHTGEIDEALLRSVGLRRTHFGRTVGPGTVVGTLTEEVRKLTGLGPLPVVAVAGHDTASAVAAVPAAGPHFAYLSSGTWSLMGIETPQAIVNEQSFSRNFTNEGGVAGTVRFLKNICGMWLYECCRREWKKESGDVSHATLIEEAMKAEGSRSLINPDDPMFANPDSMTAAIQTYCRKHDEPVPETRGQFCRCIYDSLALRYRQVFGWLKEFAPFPLDVLHVIGGGSQNSFLNQFTADSCNITVLAGPQECTAIGNVMLQAKAAGYFKDVWDMRQVIANSIAPARFIPRDTAPWKAAYEKYLYITGGSEE